MGLIKLISALVSIALIISLQARSESGARFSEVANLTAGHIDQHEQVLTRHLRGAPLPDTFDVEEGLSELTVAAMSLSLMIERENGPEDLRCIFRGMAQDAREQASRVTRADTTAELLNAFEDIRYLLVHAAAMGAIADQEHWEPFTGVDPGCARGPLD